MSNVSVSSQIGVGTPRIGDRDWSQLTLGQRIQHLEVEGYVVLPDMLDADHIARLKEQASTFETTHVDYSVHQRGRSSISVCRRCDLRANRLSTDDRVPQGIVR